MHKRWIFHPSLCEIKYRMANYMRYEGEKCPVCTEPFTADDDIVVCPVCGSPHHRGCYLNNKDCAHAKLHAEGYLFSPKVNANAESVSPLSQTGNGSVAVCPNCGKENSCEEPSCTKCGARLYFNSQTPPPATGIAMPVPTVNQYNVGKTRIPPTDMIGDNTVADTAEYIQISSSRYISKMYKMEKEYKKLSWNWAAFIFAPYWFFYRKMHTLGFLLMVILLAVTGIFSNKAVLEQNAVASETLYNYYRGQATQEQLAEETYKMQTLPGNIIISVTTLGIHLYAGLLGNYMYKKRVKKEVTEIRKNSSTNEKYRFALFRKGGISGIMCALSWLGFFCATQVLLTVLSRVLL